MLLIVQQQKRLSNKNLNVGDPSVTRFPVLCVCPQQAFNAAVAINHMKKMQLAHSDRVLEKVGIPDIKVTDVSSSEKNGRNLDPKVVESGEKMAGANLLPLVTNHVDLKSNCHPLKAAQSHLGPQHAPTIAEQGKHIYHSEPANLNGSVQTSPGRLHDVEA